VRACGLASGAARLGRRRSERGQRSGGGGARDNAREGRRGNGRAPGSISEGLGAMDLGAEVGALLCGAEQAVM